MKPTIIAVVGGKKSGKTTTIEALVKEMTKRGYEVVAVKHITEPEFTFDTEDKDTWRFTKAGAKRIVAVSADEIATVEKGKTDKLQFSEILKRCKGSEVVFVEGFRKAVSRDKSIHKIVVARSAEEVSQAAGLFSPILAFTGNYRSSGLNVPYVDTLKNPERMGDLLEKTMSKKVN